MKLFALVLLLAGCAHTTTRSTITEVGASTFHQEGKASWYGKEHQGGPTASGERFDMHQLTAAHRTLPMQTRVRVTSQLDGRSVEVRINDRGPYAKGRIIDLSWAAAKALGMLDAGVIPVVIDALRQRAFRVGFVTRRKTKSCCSDRSCHRGRPAGDSRHEHGRARPQDDSGEPWPRTCSCSASCVPTT